jgi:hypothetical protein
MKNFTLRPPCLGGEISESFFTTEYFMYQWVQHSCVLSTFAVSQINAFSHRSLRLRLNRSD